jgi:glycosyltransferase involved in cell wall biosynthesis
VAPLRVARGIQNKVLEAMAMAKPVVTTVASATPLSARPGTEIACASEPREFADLVRSLYDERRAARMGELARARVLRDYGWEASQAALEAVIETGTAAKPEALAR